MLLKLVKFFLAAPFFSKEDVLLPFIKNNVSVRLIVKICQATSPDELKKVAAKNVEIRFYTSDKFHSKIYIFGDAAALVTSSNLTYGGMSDNRECGILFTSDEPIFNKLSSLFDFYWQSASPIDKNELEKFARIVRKHSQKELCNFEQDILKEFGDIYPKAFESNREKKNKADMFRLSYKKTYQEFLTAFREVKDVYKNFGKRKMSGKIPLRLEIDSFFSYIRETYTSGESYNESPLLKKKDRRENLKEFILKWNDTYWDYLMTKIPDHYNELSQTFRSKKSIEKCDDHALISALNKLHSFHDRYRFFTDGLQTLNKIFLKENSRDRINEMIKYLLFGDGNFIDRMCDCIFSEEYYLSEFGRSNVQELFGWCNKESIPICNGRTVKALRFLGYDVLVY